jgi:hypothetical protein
MTYLQGSIVISNARFRDEVTRAAIDPTTVEFYYQINGQEPSPTITYVDATVPSVGVIARMGVGWYQTWIDTTSFVGTTGEFWDGLGVGQAPGQKQFTVTQRGFS